MNQLTATPPRAEVPSDIAPRRFLGRWSAGAILLVIGGMASYSIAINPNIDYPVIGEFLFSTRILAGLRTTLELAVVSMLIAVALGILVALLRLSHNPVAKAFGWIYVWLFRGAPLLVQILFWGNIALFYQHITIGIPFTDFVLASWETNAVITTFVASVLALSLQETAYMSEVIRSGIISVQTGQTEAALALGLSRRQTMRKVVLPQALRVIVPPTGNQAINLLKETSLVAVIAGGDLLTKAQNIMAVNLKTIELLIVATLWYLLVVSLTSIGQAILERRLGRGFGRSSRQRPTPTEAPPGGDHS